jgi:hypothetical protein
MQIQLTGMDKISSASLICMHSPREDDAQIEKIISAIHNNIYPTELCKKALIFAFKKLREHPVFDILSSQEEEQFKPTIFIRDMLGAYTEATQSLRYHIDFTSLQKRCEAARNLASAAINLMNEKNIEEKNKIIEEKNKAICHLRRHRIIFAAATGIFATLSIASSLATYYGVCHK